MSFVEISKKIGAGWMIIASLFFAFMGIFIKLAGNYYSFIELVFWRGVFGIVIMSVIAIARKGTFRTPKLKQHLSRSISGLCAMLAYFYAITQLPLATAITLSYTSPISMVVLSIILFREKITPVTTLGLLTGFVGILLLLQPNFSNDAWKAILIGLCSGFISGWAYLQVQELTRFSEPDWRIVFYFSLVLCIVPAIILTISDGWHPIEIQTLPYLIGMGVCATLAQLCMTKSYAVGNKFVASSLSYLTIVFSAILGALILQDVLHTIEIIAMVVIVASGFITRLGKASG